jgi:hypothetical protein
MAYSYDDLMRKRNSAIAQIKILETEYAKDTKLGFEKPLALEKARTHLSEVNLRMSRNL